MGTPEMLWLATINARMRSRFHRFFRKCEAGSPSACKVEEIRIIGKVPLCGSKGSAPFGVGAASASCSLLVRMGSLKVEASKTSALKSSSWWSSAWAGPTSRADFFWPFAGLELWATCKLVRLPGTSSGPEKSKVWEPPGSITDGSFAEWSPFATSCTGLFITWPEELRERASETLGSDGCNW